MNDTPHRIPFWIGNALLAFALILLFFINPLWASLGTWAMVLWMMLAGIGFYLVTRDKGPTSHVPD